MPSANDGIQARRSTIEPGLARCELSLRTLKKLGLGFPPTLLARADEVIEEWLFAQL